MSDEQKPNDLAALNAFNDWWLNTEGEEACAGLAYECAKRGWFASPGRETLNDYEQVLAGHRALVRQLDVLLNGEEGAAPQASLCDIVGQVASAVRVNGRSLLGGPGRWHVRGLGFGFEGKTSKGSTISVSAEERKAAGAEDSTAEPGVRLRFENPDNPEHLRVTEVHLIPEAATLLESCLTHLRCAWLEKTAPETGEVVWAPRGGGDLTVVDFAKLNEERRAERAAIDAAPPRVWVLASKKFPGRIRMTSLNAPSEFDRQCAAVEENHWVEMIAKPVRDEALELMKFERDLAQSDCDEARQNAHKIGLAFKDVFNDIGNLPEVRDRFEAVSGLIDMYDGDGESADDEHG